MFEPIQAYKVGCLGVERIEEIYKGKAPSGLDMYTYKVHFDDKSCIEIYTPFYVDLDKKGKCEHSWCDAQGVGGGYIFDYCNKCGITKKKD
jgi:Zn-finger protein